MLLPAAFCCHVPCSHPKPSFSVCGLRFFPLPSYTTQHQLNTDQILCTMSGSGLHPDPSSDAELAALCAAVNTISLNAAEHDSRDTTTRTQAGLLGLPTELRLRIYEMLIHPRGAVDVDSFYAVRTAGKCSALRFLDLARSL